jgi:RNA polymerase sigma-70 factor (ECF subfamily)
MGVAILSSIQMLARGMVREAAPEAAMEVALREFDLVYRFMYSRVGNPHDAEDLTQQVALKALPRLRDGWVAPAVRGYLYATARSVLASFWAGRGRIREAELGDNVLDDGRGSELSAPPEAAAWVERTLSALPAHYRKVLELRFLRGYSLREAAEEMGKSVGGVKVMQLRALRAAAAVSPDL